MDESFKLDKEQHDAVYQKLERKMLSKSTPSAEPTVVIMGGRPGAGKFCQATIYEGRRGCCRQRTLSAAHTRRKAREL